MQSSIQFGYIQFSRVGCISFECASSYKVSHQTWFCYLSSDLAIYVLKDDWKLARLQQPCGLTFVVKILVFLEPEGKGWYLFDQLAKVSHHASDLVMFYYHTVQWRNKDEGLDVGCGMGFGYYRPSQLMSVYC